MARAALRAIEQPQPNIVPEIITKHIRVTVAGIKPLMTHNPASMGMAPESAKGSRIPTREVEAEAGTYRLEDGTCAIKGDAFRNCLIDAASAWKIKRGTATRMVTHIIIVEELVPLQSPTGEPIHDYVIDTRRVRVQRAGVLRSRPRFDHWQCEFTIEFDPLLIADPEMLISILGDGGNRNGVGDYRPSTKGYFGRFRVLNWQLLD